MSKYPDIFADLIAPFAKEEVKTRPQGGRQLSYVTARTVMNRLDDVLGPENWWDEYHPMENSVLCKLSIKLPDGSVLTKCDAGGYAGMSDQGDDDKSGFSDAFKRAAVKFGVGRYLYRDGVPSFKHEAEPPPVNGTPRPANRATSQSRVTFAIWVVQFCEDKNSAWLDHMKQLGVKKFPAEIVNPFQLTNHLVKWGSAAGMFKGPGPKTQADREKIAIAFWETSADVVAAEATDYCRKEWKAARAKVKPPREPGDDDDPGVDEVLDSLAEQGVVK